jgi:hypothetical protein
MAFCKERGIVSLAAITKTHLSDFKLTLNLKSGNSNSLRISLSVLGGMFNWATENGYLPGNPFPRFKLKFKPEKVHPPSDEEILRVLEEASKTEVRLFAHLMRESGMAIIDTTMLKQSCLTGTLIESERAKTGIEFRVHPTWIADELRALPRVDANGEYFFWNSVTRPKKAIAANRRELQSTFDAATL